MSPRQNNPDTISLNKIITMKNYRKFKKKLFVALLVFIDTTISSQLSAEIKSSLEFDYHTDGTFSVNSRAVPLELLLARIHQVSNIKIYIDRKSKKRPITTSVYNISLVQLLKRIVGDNYVMVFDGNAEFSGQIKITDNRAKMFFFPSSSLKSVTENYIRKRHKLIEKLAYETPHKKLNAQISFQGYLSSGQLVELVKDNHLKPVSLNIGWKENGGGYDLKNHESIESAVEMAAIHHQQFIAEIQADANRQVAGLRQQGMNDPDIHAELEFQKNADGLAAIFHKNGMLFYGMRVAGTASTLHSILNNKNTVRLVDPLWGGAVEAEISKVYPTMKIAIPLVPEQEELTQ